jgi:selenide,water dikinase
MCEGSGLSAEIEFSKVPKFDFLDTYIQQKSMPGGTQRNWDSYGTKISTINDLQRVILADPQTSGGLLVSVDANKRIDFENFVAGKGLEVKPFGQLIARKENVVYVN